MSIVPAPPESTVCYISGPIHSVPDARARFELAAIVLREDGWIPINPHAKSPSIEGMRVACDLAGVDDFRDTPEYAQLMRISFYEVLMSHVVFVLPGWEHSRGARNEVHLANIVHMPVRRYAVEPTERHLIQVDQTGLAVGR